MICTELEQILTGGLESLGMPFEKRLSLAELMMGARVQAEYRSMSRWDEWGSVPVQTVPTVEEIYAAKTPKPLFIRPSTPLKDVYALVYGISLSAQERSPTLLEAQTMERQQDIFIQRGEYGEEFIELHAEIGNSVPGTSSSELLSLPYFFRACRLRNGGVVRQYSKADNHHLAWCKATSATLRHKTSPTQVANIFITFLREHALF